jgi:hypothetical protein
MPPLFFKDNQSAFEYSCEYLDCSVAENRCLPALVLDAKGLFGTATAVLINDDGSQAALLAVASSDFGFRVMATTIGSKGPILEPGQLVAWRASVYAPKLAKASNDKRFGWVGLIEGTLKPEFVNGNWVGDTIFHGGQ